MRSPSARVLADRVDIYVPTAGRDADGGVQFPYPSTPTYSQMACTVQPTGSDEIEDQERITKITSYKIMFGSPITLDPRAKIIWVDNVGVTHVIFANADRDEAGRGAAFTVFCTERS